jgi:ATP-dependent RNA helicase DDX41
VHGDKDQEERLAAIQAYKRGEKDVLVATDVASKGLDFAAVQHVVNFDMPEEIENYVHRIGRTGRSGRTGVATTFVNTRECSESILLDLKHLLREAKQRVPTFLTAIHDPIEEMEAVAQASGVKGCAYCGGLGHRIAECPKLRAENQTQQAARKDWFGAKGGVGAEY